MTKKNTGKTSDAASPISVDVPIVTDGKGTVIQATSVAVEEDAPPPQTLWEELAENRNVLTELDKKIAETRPPIDHLELHTQLRSSIDSWVMDAKRYEHENKQISFADSTQFSDRFYNLRDAGKAYLDCENKEDKLKNLESSVGYPVAIG